MNPIEIRVRRYERRYGWTNCILRVDLSDMSARTEPSDRYVPDYLGGRGLAARMAWEGYPTPLDPFDPANPLMIVPGALTGTRAPYAGRTSVCAFSPQGYPYPWFTRSNIGGWFGGALKRAGYDALIITGAARGPVRLHVTDDVLRILPADDLWGLDAVDALTAVEGAEGRGVRALTIGPAGERLSRIATIQAGSSTACGQGGFGAVMGSKRLKAISVIGTGRVKAAAPATLRAFARALAHQAQAPAWFGRDMQAFNKELAAAGDGWARLRPCSEGCVTPCTVEFRDVPGVAHARAWSGDWVCIACRFAGTAPDAPPHAREAAPWYLGRRAGFEMNVLSNRYGLNQFDVLTGMVPWLVACQEAGLIGEVNGQAMDWDSAQFWASFLRAVAYREGMGDVLAEGGWAAAQALDLGAGLAARYYPGWGHPSHWDGRNGWGQPFPYWLSAVLQWMSDTRDPFSTGHGSLHVLRAVRPLFEMDDRAQWQARLEAVRAFGRRVYGSARATDPHSGYADKAQVGYVHTVRPVVKDCVPVDDQVFPMLWNEDSDDHAFYLRDIDGVGDVEGTSVEYHLFRAGTGVDWDEGQFWQAAERVLALERALQVRHWGRDRATDELVLPYFEQPEWSPNPLLGERHRLDRAQFKLVVDAFYALHGWDRETGWPTEARLRALGLEDVYTSMVAGATQRDSGDETR